MKKYILFSCMLVLAATSCFAAAQSTRSPDTLYGVYDGNWGLAYYMKGDALYSPDWELEYYIRGNTLFDKHWRRYGIIKGPDIYDDHNYLRYRIKEYRPPERKDHAK